LLYTWLIEINYKLVYNVTIMTVNISPKFSQYIINDLPDDKLPPQVVTARSTLNTIYANQENMAPDCKAVFHSTLGFQKLEDTAAHIAVHPQMNEWVFKCKRSDMQTAEDTHLYRVRKADKIRRMQLPGVVVPLKYLYRLPNGEYIVLAQKLIIHRKIENPSITDPNVSQETKDFLKKCSPFVPIKLTPSQGWNITKVIFRTNATDLNLTNFFHNEKGQLVLPDTEPHLRSYRKMAWRWIPGAYATFCHFLSTAVVQSLSTKEDFSTKMSMHVQKTVELARYLIGMIVRIALAKFVSKGATRLSDNSTSIAIKAFCFLLDKTAQVSKISLISFAVLSVTSHLALPFLKL
jgi:hypothetical protein